MKRLEIEHCLMAVVIVLLVIFAFGTPAASGAAPAVEYPANETISETGILFNRKGAEEAPAERTTPYDPATAPLFESIPATEMAPPAAPAPAVVVSDASPTALTPEQKEALKSLIVQAVTFLVGSMIGSGAASPFLKMILEKLLGAVGGATPAVPGAAPTRVKRRRAVKKKPTKPKAAA